MFIYEQSTGNLISGFNHNVVGCGYSGAVGYKNDPLAQMVHNKGPIPEGEWGILGPPVDTATHGPYVLHLYAKPGTETYGRSGFLIHGDNVLHPGTASEGCIILARPIREFIWNSGDRDLVVVSKYTPITPASSIVSSTPAQPIQSTQHAQQVIPITRVPAQIIAGNLAKTLSTFVKGANRAGVAA